MLDELDTEEGTKEPEVIEIEDESMCERERRVKSKEGSEYE